MRHWHCTQPPVANFLAALGEEARGKAMAALELAAEQPLADGAMQMAVAVAVAQR